MKYKIWIKIVMIGILACCLGFSGCGEDAPDQDTEINNGVTAGSESETAQPSQADRSPLPAPSSTPDSAEETEEYLRAPMPGQSIPEGREIVTLGTFGKVYASSPMMSSVDAFNQSQEKYFVQIEIYSNLEKFLIDIVRKQGTDLYNLYFGTNPDLLARQGVLEDLTSYFEGSDEVCRNDIVDAVWRAGSVEDKLYFLIPGFTCQGLLVEKGYTKEGAWSGKDYLELGKKYPGSMLDAQIQNPGSMILSRLKEYVTGFIDWEDKTCSFDSDAFIAMLEDLKALSSYSYEAVEQNATMADLIRGKTYLSTNVTIGMDYGMYFYRNITDAFGGGYEIAGYPTADGSLKYLLGYEEIYGMNAASENKEGAWAFLEYLVSGEYQQPMPPNRIQGDVPLLGVHFPVRKDSLERGLQANVDYVTNPDEIPYTNINQYTREKTKGYEGFTEEDKQAVLYIIDNSYRTSFSNDYTILNILNEETQPFFQGQKSAGDVVKIIQSRISMYLAE